MTVAKRASFDLVLTLLPCALLIEAALILIHAARCPAEQVGLVLPAYGVGGAAYVRVPWCL